MSKTTAYVWLRVGFHPVYLCICINFSIWYFLVSSYDSLLDEKLCQVTVRVLGVSSSPEVSELCLELLHGQAENGKFLCYSLQVPVLFIVWIISAV